MGSTSVRQLVGYGVGDLGINLYFIAGMTYLMYFYTDVYGLSAAAAGGVLLVARIVDAVTDPVMGMVAERTNARSGRMRPYILYGALPLAVISVLTFTAVDGDATFRLWWAYSTYILFGLFYTVVGIPYAALTASLTRDSDERTRLTTVRMAGAFSGGFLVSVGTMPLVGLFDDRATGFFWVMTGYAVLATLFLFITWRETHEVPVPAAEQPVAIRDSLRAVFANPPLASVIVLFCCGMLSFTVRQGSTVYYFQYCVQRPELIGPFFSVTLLVMLCGLLGVPALAAKLGKARAIIAGGLLTIAGCVGLWFTPFEAIAWIFLWGAVINLGATPIAVLGWAMIPDTVEYAQLRHGVRADGAIFSFASFFQKVAKSIGGAGVGFVLALGGYVANQAQSPAAITAILSLMTLVPIGIVLVMIAAAAVHRLDRSAHQAILRQIDEQIDQRIDARRQPV
ncbi:MAG: MFS transporter [Pseudomonadales bacterium]|nr:MFS transporter [Pseudomonadales bacterium]MCP5185080.1 MFS transporter [Pseudomonadales bacterium]